MDDLTAVRGKYSTNCIAEEPAAKAGRRGEWPGTFCLRRTGGDYCISGTSAGAVRASTTVRRAVEREESNAHLERGAVVLSVLHSTLHAAEQDAKKRHLSPDLHCARPNFQYPFPAAEITIDQNLHIVGVIREIGYQEAFHHLSMETQEQVAISIRLASAEMLVQQGHPATAILDDTFVFSDDRRMSRMFDILNMAAQNIQVIIITCREQLEELGGRLLSLQPGISEELVPA